MKEEFFALEARKQNLSVMAKQVSPQALASAQSSPSYTGNALSACTKELNRAELRSEPAQALRGFIDEVRLIPENGRLEIELLGDLAEILALGADGKKPATVSRDGLQVTLVAGTGFEPVTFRL